MSVSVTVIAICPSPPPLHRGAGLQPTPLHSTDRFKVRGMDFNFATEPSLAFARDNSKSSAGGTSRAFPHPPTVGMSFRLARLPGCDRWKIGVAFDRLFAHMFAAVEQEYRKGDSD